MIKNAIESLFIKGGTKTEKWVLVNGDKVELSKFTRLPFYNIHHQEVKRLGVVYFGIHKNMFVVFNDKTMKTLKIDEGDSEYVFRFMKTKVSCISKDSLMEHFKESTDPDSPFNASSHGRLNELLNK